MSYTLHTETAFRSDSRDCPICKEDGPTDYLPASDDFTLWRCIMGHPWYFIETVTSDDGRKGAGELGYWTES